MGVIPHMQLGESPMQGEALWGNPPAMGAMGSQTSQKYYVYNFYRFPDRRCPSRSLFARHLDTLLLFIITIP